MLSPGSRHVYGPGGLHRALVDLLAAQFPPHQPEVPARRQQLPARGGELPAGQWLEVGRPGSQLTVRVINQLLSVTFTSHFYFYPDPPTLIQ